MPQLKPLHHLATLGANHDISQGFLFFFGLVFVTAPSPRNILSERYFFDFFGGFGSCGHGVGFVRIGSRITFPRFVL